jgi:NADH dehydrogenase
MSTEAQNKSEEYLKQLGVTLMNNTRVDAYDGENVTYTTELLSIQ